MIQLHHVSLDPNETNTEIHSMATIGYIRVSTVEQNTDRQLDGLQFDKTFTDHCSGGSTQRPALESMLEFVREGDTVNVHSIDRLARNSVDLLRLVGDFKLLGVSVVSHRESLTFSAGHQDPMNELMLSMIGAFAQFERSVLKERQAEGIAKAKGIYTGTKPSIDRKAVLELLSDAVSPSQIAKDLGIGRNSVYRIKAETI